MARPRLWTDDQLRTAVAASRDLRSVLRRLGVEPGGKTYDAVRRRIARLALDTAHFTPGSEPLRARWDDDQLRSALASSRSLREAIGKLGLVGAGGNYDLVRRRIAVLGLDTSHLVGKSWARGRQIARPKIPLEAILVANRPTTSSNLRLRLIEAGLKPAACELCGWARRSLDGRLPLELDHINGDHDDNRLDNLRILCPNCHALQPTHRGSNQKRRRVGGATGQTLRS